MEKCSHSNKSLVGNVFYLDRFDSEISVGGGGRTWRRWRGAEPGEESVSSADAAQYGKRFLEQRYKNLQTVRKTSVHGVKMLSVLYF